MKKIMMLILILLFAVPAFGVTINATTSSTKQVNKRDTASKVTYTGATVTAGSTQVFRLSSPNSYGYVKQPTFFNASDNCTAELYESEALANAGEKPIISMNITSGYYSPEILPLDFAAIEANPNQYKMYLRVDNSGGGTATGVWIATFIIGSN